MNLPGNTPVIVGIGEHREKPRELSAALEPVGLWQQALSAAVRDSRGLMLEDIDSLELVGSVTWRYRDPVDLLCRNMGIDPARRINASMGGETPVRLLHQAAIAVFRGESRVAAVVGGEAMHSMTRARRQRERLDWTPLASKEEAARVPADRIETSAISRQLGIRGPTEMYPLYEVASQAGQNKSPLEGFAESGALWERFARVAAGNPSAWIQSPTGREAITAISPENRLICWPYTKLMVANPTVNQAAAFIVTTLEKAVSAGVPAGQLIYVWGGAAAAEPDNYLERDNYRRSPAQAATLEQAAAIAGGLPNIDAMELYSCFPVVPKLAMAELGVDPASCVPTVTGGLTFFGGPMNNYMSHAVCAMVRRLRGTQGDTGLLYGQGGFLTKHHTLVLSSAPCPAPLPVDYCVQAVADRQRGPAPQLLQHYTGPARIETYTVIYDREGCPAQGVTVLRTPQGQRTMARVAPETEMSLALLTDWQASAVGTGGVVRRDTSGNPQWIADRDGACLTKQPH